MRRVLLLVLLLMLVSACDALESSAAEPAVAGARVYAGEGGGPAVAGFRRRVLDLVGSPVIQVITVREPRGVLNVDVTTDADVPAILALLADSPDPWRLRVQDLSLIHI